MLFAQGADVHQDHQHDQYGEDRGDGPVDEIQWVFYPDHCGTEFDLHDPAQHHAKNDRHDGQVQSFQYEA